MIDATLTPMWIFCLQIYSRCTCSLYQFALNVEWLVTTCKSLSTSRIQNVTWLQLCLRHQCALLLPPSTSSCRPHTIKELEKEGSLALCSPRLGERSILVNLFLWYSKLNYHGVWISKFSKLAVIFRLKSGKICDDDLNRQDKVLTIFSILELAVLHFYWNQTVEPFWPNFSY